jgi:hypothetical protein
MRIPQTVFHNVKRLSSLPVILTFCFAIVLTGLSGCNSTPPVAVNQIAVAEVADFSRSFTYLQDAEQGALKIAGTLQPGDTMWVGAISELSLKKIDPILFSTRKTRTPNEIAAFLDERNKFQSKITDWFRTLKAKPQMASDICSAIRLAVYELNRSPAKKKALLVYSDMNDTVSGKCDVSFAGIDVRLLYVYPSKNNSAAFSNYAKHVKAQVAAGSPASLEVLFPAQSKTFEAEEFVADLRRN